HTVCLLRLLCGRTSGWSAQLRDDHSVPLSVACRHLWPQTLVGAGSIALLAFTQPAAIPYTLFVSAGLAVSIPFAVITAMPGVGRALARGGWGGARGEMDPPRKLHPLPRPAFETGAQPPQPQPRAA